MARHGAHIPKIGGSNPPPATRFGWQNNRRKLPGKIVVVVGRGRNPPVDTKEREARGGHEKETIKHH